MLTLRPLQPDDEPRLARFLRGNAVPAVTRNFHPFPMDGESARRLAREPGRDRYYLALRGEEVVALGFLRGWNEGYAVPSFGIVVDHRCHGQGIGRRLTEHALAEARRLGCDRVRLSVYASNAAAHHLYRSLGFVEIEAQRVEVEGQPDRKLVMVRELP